MAPRPRALHRRSRSRHFSGMDSKAEVGWILTVSTLMSQPFDISPLAYDHGDANDLRAPSLRSQVVESSSLEPREFSLGTELLSFA